MDGPDIAWYTNPWVSQGIIDDKFDNGKASDLCRIEHADDALYWVANGNDYLKENCYNSKCAAWIEKKRQR